MSKLLTILGAWIGFQILFLSCLKAEEPTWVNETPHENHFYKFYVGRASNVPTESEAFKSATNDAYESAIRENFGFRTSVQTQQYETMEKTDMVKRVDQKSAEIEVNGFTQVSAYKEKLKDGSYNVWLLFRYNKVFIEQERLRLASVASSGQKPVTEFGDASNKSAEIVNISTEPPDAVVYVDGVRWGKTPVRLIGQFEPGQHILHLDHPNYNYVEEKLILTKGITVNVNRILEQSAGTIRVVTEPPGALISVNDQAVGISPTKEIQILAQKPTYIKASHDEADTFIQEVTLDRSEKREINVSMPLKPAYLSIMSEPLGASVVVDNAKLGETGITPTGMVRVTPGHHKFVLKKPAFRDHCEALYLKGGEKKAVPTIRLAQLKSALEVGGGGSQTIYYWENRVPISQQANECDTVEPAPLVDNRDIDIYRSHVIVNSERKLATPEVMAVVSAGGKLMPTYLGPFFGLTQSSLVLGINGGISWVKDHKYFLGMYLLGLSNLTSVGFEFLAFSFSSLLPLYGGFRLGLTLRDAKATVKDSFNKDKTETFNGYATSIGTILGMDLIKGDFSLGLEAGLMYTTAAELSAGFNSINVDPITTVQMLITAKWWFFQ